MTLSEAKIGTRVYNRYRDLFGEIVSIEIEDTIDFVNVKYEWPVDPKSPTYKETLDSLDIALV